MMDRKGAKGRFRRTTTFSPCTFTAASNSALVTAGLPSAPRLEARPNTGSRSREAGPPVGSVNMKRSREYLTSSGVSASPLWNFTPFRTGNLKVRPSAEASPFCVDGTFEARSGSKAVRLEPLNLMSVS